jgi:hypothetical protein
MKTSETRCLLIYAKRKENFMQEDEMKVQIDYAAIAKEIADKAVGDMVAAFMPDEKTKKFWEATLVVHRRYGIDAVTSMKIMQEIAELIKEVKE